MFLPVSDNRRRLLSACGEKGSVVENIVSQPLPARLRQRLMLDNTSVLARTLKLWRSCHGRLSLPASDSTSERGAERPEQELLRVARAMHLVRRIPKTALSNHPKDARKCKLSCWPPKKAAAARARSPSGWRWPPRRPGTPYA